jgi:competence protein ComGC
MTKRNMVRRVTRSTAKPKAAPKTLAIKKNNEKKDKGKKARLEIVKSDVKPMQVEKKENQDQIHFDVKKLKAGQYLSETIYYKVVKIMREDALVEN